MKRYLLLLLLLVPSFAFSQNLKFDKLLSKYDVAQYLDTVQDPHFSLEFWEEISKNNKGFLSIVDKIKRKTKLAKETATEWKKMEKPSEMFLNSLQTVDYFQTYLDKISDFMDLRYIVKNITVKAFEDTAPNAFTTPYGQMYITDTLFHMSGFNKNPEYLIGVMAHEFAHYVCQHSLQQIYATKKKLNTNRIIAGIAAAVEGAADVYAKTNGVSGKTQEEYQAEVENLFGLAYIDAYGRFKYKYSREQEIEADIIAYRYLDWVGIGGKYYIDALKAIGTDNDKYYDKQSDHPTMEYRIKLLEYLASRDKEKDINLKPSETLLKYNNRELEKIRLIKP